ncbi:MAG: hypothetical protein DME91_06370 [Verrucomicrobia bacterium]|nr:MAG: hypothetical protein DME91_06370 [Verrucomicrobiota bacterium]
MIGFSVFYKLKNRFADVHLIIRSGRSGENFQKNPELWFPVPLEVCMKTYYWLGRNRLLSPLRFAIALLLIVLVVSASSSSASPAQAYHGTITSGTFLCNGEPSGFNPTVTGTWNLSIDPKTPAQVTLTVFYNYSLHLALGYNALMLVSENCNTAGCVYSFSGFGDSVTATLDTTMTPARFSWQVQLAGGCSPQRPYNSLTFFGVATP